MADEAADPTELGCATERMEETVGQMLKESGSEDVLRESALVWIAKPYDTFARLLSACIYGAAQMAGPHMPAPSERARAVALDLQPLIREIESIQAVPRLSKGLSNALAETRSGMIATMYRLGEASRPGLRRRKGGRKKQ